MSYAQELEDSLGDVFDSRSPASFPRAVELDERQQFPEEFLDLLRRLGVHHFLVPKELGGALQSFPECLTLLRLIARRDLTAAIAFGQTFLGSIPVWIAGAESQRQTLASSIREGSLGCLALTEEEHGGDLMACEFRATPEKGDYLLSGRKWLINNGTRGAFASVFAASSFDVTPSGFTLFLLDKRNPAVKDAVVGAPRVRTHGIRGADISGFSCESLRLPSSAVIGEQGRGYEITLKTLQISRTMCAALSLGAGDTALRATLDFALHRKISGATVAAISSVRDQLAGGYADLLMCECLGLAAARGLHHAVSRLSVWSSVVKYFVPFSVEAVIRACAIVLGARHYLREGHFAGVFEKVMRDNAVVGLFDGSSAVNLHIIAGQLGALCWGRKRSPAASGLKPLFAMVEESSPRAFPRVSEMAYTNDGRDEIVEGLAAVRGTGLPANIAELVRLIHDRLEALDRSFEELREAGDRRSNSTRKFALAAEYCRISAGAAAVHTWHHNRGSRDDFFESAEWLVVILHRVLALHPPESQMKSVFDHLTAQFERRELFSLFPLRLS